MNTLARIPASTLALATAGWIALIFVAWLFTPGGQTVIFVVELAIREHGSFAADLPLSSMRFWALTAAVLAFAPPTLLFVAWGVARRAAQRAAA